MLDANISALAIVNDESDSIVGNFSMSDIRTLGVIPREAWGELLRGSSMDYLRTSRETAVTGGSAVFREGSGECCIRMASLVAAITAVCSCHV
jgi:hypothetical protein